MKIAIKVDVDTDRGTRVGVENLLTLFQKNNVNATFLFSLGPDNTGRALKRIFRPGFLKKVSRTSVIQVYGLKTLLNGVLWPGPHIGYRNKAVMLKACQAGFEIGVHCYDHIRWQDYLHKMSLNETASELKKAHDVFVEIFGFTPKTAGAAGWQANKNSLQAYDDACFAYGSDCRGYSPFFPRVGNKVYKTLQLPTTLPTLDELLGRPEYPIEALSDYYLSLLKDDGLNVLTIHAELEGMAYLSWFESFIHKAKCLGVQFVTTNEYACEYLAKPDLIPICDLEQGEIEGRSGFLAVQGRA